MPYVSPRKHPGNALAGGLIKQDGKLNFVVVVASGDRLKEVMLEPPRVVGKGQIATNCAAESDHKIAPESHSGQREKAGSEMMNKSTNQRR